MEFELIKIIGEFGSIGITLAIVLWMIPKIMKEHRDERQEMRREFTTVVKNHLRHTDKREKATSESNEKLAVSLDRLTGVIKKMGGNK